MNKLHRKITLLQANAVRCKINTIGSLTKTERRAAIRHEPWRKGYHPLKLRGLLRQSGDKKLAQVYRAMTVQDRDFYRDPTCPRPLWFSFDEKIIALSVFDLQFYEFMQTMKHFSDDTKQILRNIHR